jgi:hypothetical protein
MQRIKVRTWLMAKAQRSGYGDKKGTYKRKAEISCDTCGKSYNTFYGRNYEFSKKPERLSPANLSTSLV